MDTTTIRKLNDMTSAFYQRHAHSFSQTRQSAWPGWAGVLQALKSDGAKGDVLSVLDVASGNGRFEAYVARELPHQRLHLFTVDNCSNLAAQASWLSPGETGEAPRIVHSHQELDVIDVLMKGELGARLEAPPCDVVVCFGFFHHVPSSDLRLELLKALLQAVKPGGLLAVSLWRFMDDEIQAAKVHKASDAAAAWEQSSGIKPEELEEGDYLLGWQGNYEVFRYCHSFTDQEIAWLLEQVKTEAHLVTRYRSDGRNNTQNEYLILKSL